MDFISYFRMLRSPVGHLKFPDAWAMGVAQAFAWLSTAADTYTRASCLGQHAFRPLLVWPKQFTVLGSHVTNEPLRAHNTRSQHARPAMQLHATDDRERTH